jgi:hypothetical protein
MFPRAITSLSPDLEMYTCTVGKTFSAAANYVHDVPEVQELLDSLVESFDRDQKFYSAIDLTLSGVFRRRTICRLRLC